jgi:hypothetical protein
MGAHGSLFARRGNKSRHIGRFIGVEYYDNLGPGRHEQLYAVTDFKLGECDVEFGIGYGLTRNRTEPSPKPSLAMHSRFQGKAMQTKRRRYRQTRWRDVRRPNWRGRQ